MTPTFYPALFFFLAAGAVSLAAFGSVTTWVVARSREREAHERFALLRLLAERPVDSARLAIDELRDHERRAEERRQREQRLGGLVTIGVGVGLALMLLATGGARSGAWAVGLIPGLVGVALMVAAPRGGGRPS
jgi:Flp pilus assembly protein TadB